MLLAATAALVLVPLWALALLLGLGAAGLAVGLVLAVAVVAAAWFTSASMALRLTSARPTTAGTHPRLHNLVEGLCIADGLPMPQVHVVDDPAPNAFAVGRDPARAVLVVTTGLLDTLSRIELEGLLAHELSHVKNYDIQVSTLAVALVRAGSTLVPVAPVVARLVRYGVRRDRELLADTTGVALTRYPPGLVSALEKVRGHPGVVRSASRATAHLWTESPLARTPAAGHVAWLDRLFETHPPIEERIQALKEL